MFWETHGDRNAAMNVETGLPCASVPGLGGDELPSFSAEQCPEEWMRPFLECTAEIPLCHMCKKIGIPSVPAGPELPWVISFAGTRKRNGRRAKLGPTLKSLRMTCNDKLCRAGKWIKNCATPEQA